MHENDTRQGLYPNHFLILQKNKYTLRKCPSLVLTMEKEIYASGISLESKHFLTLHNWLRVKLSVNQYPESSHVTLQV